MYNFTTTISPFANDQGACELPYKHKELSIAEINTASIIYVASQLPTAIDLSDVGQDIGRHGLPTTNRLAIEDGGSLMLGLGPDRWLFLSTAANHLHTLNTKFDPLHYSVTDQSGSWVGLRLSGALLHDVLSRLCPVDTHPDAFKTGHCFQTTMEAHYVIAAKYSSNPNEVDIYLQRSLARSFWETLHQAADSLCL